MVRINKSWLILFGFIALHLFCWTLGADISHTMLPYDMAENYAWGQEMELGYYKHPPLFAWVTYIWLSIFGVHHFSYFLLSQVNVIIAMIFIFLLSRRFVSKNKAVFAVILLEFIICYNFKSLRFNANTILLPLFPAVSLFFVKSLQENKLNDWILFGFTAALAMLSKYASICLLLTFIVYTLHKRRDIFKNQRVYFAIFVFFITLLPHIYWMFQTDFLTLRYVQDKAQTKHFFGYYGLLFPMSQIPYIILAFAVAILTTTKQLKTDDAEFIAKNRVLLFYITFVPTLFMAFFGFVMNMRIIESWGIPNWFLLSTFLLSSREISKPKLMILLVALVNIGYLAYGISVKILDIPTKHTQFDAKVVNAEIEQEWNYITQNRPIIYAVGSSNPVQDFIFYSKQHPHALFEFNRIISPWIPEHYEKRSSIVMCELASEQCKINAIFYLQNLDFITIEKNGLLIYIPR